MKIKIAVATYGLQEKIVHDLQSDVIPDNVELTKMNLALSELAAEARKLEQARAVDAFVASGGNAATLEQIITTVPVINLKPTASDMINVIRETSLHADRVAIIFYRNTVEDIVRTMSSLSDIVDIKIDIFFYSTRKELEETIGSIKASGVMDIIGGSLAIQVAAEHGLYGHYMITEHGVVSAIKSAAEMVKTRYEETILSRQLNSVLYFIKEGIVATNREDVITICNPSAERIFGIRASDAVGKKVESVIPNTRLKIVREAGVKELNQIQVEGSVHILTNRIPIVDNGMTIGALATFNDVYEIENAEAQIRRKLYSRGLTAKYEFSDIIGSGPEITKAIAKAKEYAGSDMTLLIAGESGTGKELFAQSIHNMSRRKGKPFVALNCAAVSSQLLESELFGYEEGAFTGAKRGGKKGVFELADTGTVFLDEISEMSLDTQAHLLRVLEQKEIMRVGGEKIRPVDIHVITATNKNLKQMVAEGTFRKDLYYRLNVLYLRLPSLAERSSDIPELVYYYLQRLCPEVGTEELKAVAENPRLRAYNWPGNVRELRNFAERFSVLCRTSKNHEEIISDFVHPPYEYALPDTLQSAYSEKQNAIDEVEILRALKRCGGNKTRASEMLGISRATLWRKMKSLELE